MFQLKTSILFLLLSVNVLDGQVCIERSVRQTKLKKKLDRFVKLTDKLLCLELGPEKVEEIKVVFETTKTPTAVTSTTQQLITMPSTTSAAKFPDEMCGRRFNPVSDPNAKMVHCWIHAHLYAGLISKNLDPNLCTHAHLLLFFSIGEDYTLTLLPDTKDDFLRILQLFKSKNVPVLLSIGEEEGFDGQKYSKMASTEEGRAKFVANVVEVLLKYELGGFLANWIYPVAWNNNPMKFAKKDFDTYPLLMKALSEKLRERSLALHAVGTHLLGISMMYNFEKLKGLIDLWHLSLYHFEGSWSSATAIASPLKRVADCVKAYSKYIPHSSMVLGITVHNSPVVVYDKSNTKLNSMLRSRKPQSTKFRALKEICEEAAKGGVTVVNSEVGGNPYTYAFKDADWVSYDSALVVKHKSEFVKEKKLAGIFMRFVGDDDVEGACKCGKFHILRAINEGLRGDGSCIPPVCP